jgi:hypothetical protein
MGDSVKNVARAFVPLMQRSHTSRQNSSISPTRSIAWLATAQLSQRLFKSNFNRGAITQALPNHFTNCAFRHPWMREIGSDAAFPF